MVHNLESNGAATEERRQHIEKLLLTEKIDLRELKRYSRQPGGFIDNKLRARVWPKLLGINRFCIPDYRKYVASHQDDSQIRCDIERSLWNHKENKDWMEPVRDKRRKALSDIIVAVLCRNRSLHYYQGYHDVCSVFLLVVNDDHLAFALSEIVSDRYLRDFMAKGDLIIPVHLSVSYTANYYHNHRLPNTLATLSQLCLFIPSLPSVIVFLTHTVLYDFSPYPLSAHFTVDFLVLSKAMRLIMTLIKAHDPQLYAFLSSANVEPYFATSWLITW